VTGTFIVLLILAAGAQAAELSPKTLNAFQAYIEAADRAMRERPQSPARLAAKPGAPPVVEGWEGKGVRDVADGLVHDWVGAIFVEKARLKDAIEVLRNVDKDKDYYPQVIASRTLKREGDRAAVSMRLLKKKIITVVLDAHYDVQNRDLGGGRYQIWSKSTKISEVSNAGKPDEHVKPPGTGHGFLWRLNSYWLLEERNGGLYMELRAISLTRDIPAGLGWAIKPMVTSLPRESLVSTLEGTAKAMLWYSRQN
jgi:hypothetical protein